MLLHELDCGVLNYTIQLAQILRSTNPLKLEREREREGGRERERERERAVGCARLLAAEREERGCGRF
jgi:hypothetical protein